MEVELTMPASLTYVNRLLRVDRFLERGGEHNATRAGRSEASRIGVCGREIDSWLVVAGCPGFPGTLLLIMNERIRILSVDDHPRMREGIAMFINSQPDC